MSGMHLPPIIRLSFRNGLSGLMAASLLLLGLFPLTAVAEPVPRPALPTWQVGEWVRYEVDVTRRVPARAEFQLREEREHWRLAITGRETLGEQTFWWYEARVILYRYWQKDTIDGPMRLKTQPRRAVLRFLVDGPGFTDIRRYQLKIDDGPVLEYRSRETGEAIPPPGLIEWDLLRPFAPPENARVHKIGPGQWLEKRFAGLYRKIRTRRVLLDKTIPVTQIAEETLAGDPYSNHTIHAIDWGHDAVSDITTDPLPVLLTTDGIQYIAFRATRPYPADAMVKDLAAGMTWLNALGDPENSDREGNEKHLRLARWQDSDLLKKRGYGFWWTCGSNLWYLERFDRYRSNFRGLNNLDEPICLMFQRTSWQRRHPEHAINWDSLKTPAQARQAVVEAIRNLLNEYTLWHGWKIPDYDNNFLTDPWYALQAGCSGFYAEGHEGIFSLSRHIRGERKVDPFVYADFTDRQCWTIALAALRGAARSFHARALVSIYPQEADDIGFGEGLRYRKPVDSIAQAKIAYDEGQREFLTFIMGEPAGMLHRVQREIFRAVQDHAADNPQSPEPARTVVFMPADATFSAAAGARNWSLWPADETYHREWKRFFQSLVPLLDKNERFDIACADRFFKPAGYDRLVNVNETTVSPEIVLASLDTPTAVTSGDSRLRLVSTTSQSGVFVFIRPVNLTARQALAIQLKAGMGTGRRAYRVTLFGRAPKSLDHIRLLLNTTGLDSSNVNILQWKDNDWVVVANKEALHAQNYWISISPRNDGLYIMCDYRENGSSR